LSSNYIGLIAIIFIGESLFLFFKPMTNIENGINLETASIVYRETLGSVGIPKEKIKQILDLVSSDPVKVNRFKRTITELVGPR